MLLQLASCCLLLAGACLAQDYQDFNSRPAPQRLNSGNHQEVKPTPIPILKQINRHNEDGSYTYGYEGADGSFKIETKLATGEVKGKYGYVDESTGKVRVVEYGANKYGFQPSGDGITVAPPTLVDESTDKNGQLIDYDDEPQQQQQPKYQQPQQPKYRPQPKQHRPAVAPQPQYHYEQQQQPQQQYSPAPVPQRQSQFPNADDVYSARQRPARPDSDYDGQQQTFIPTPQVQEPQYESPIVRSFPRPQQQQQHRIGDFQAPRAGSHLAQLAQQNQPQQQQQQQQYQPQQQLQQQQQQQQQYQPRPAQSGRSTSVLDQLAKDFALPQGGSPALHDITYTYY